MNKNAKIYIAGHQGMAGSALMRELQRQGFINLTVQPRSQLDLTRSDDVRAFFAQEQPDYIFLAAARVGGIIANQTYPAEFIRENLLIQTNVIDAAYRFGAKKLMFLGSSCIYPKYAPQPINEDSLLTGNLESTNEAYAVAKIAGIKMCEAYRKQYDFNAIAIIPPNLYGPGDNFSLTESHVIPALLRKMHDAKLNGKPSVELWGSGEPKREFLFVDDLAEACVLLMQTPDSPQLLNVGANAEITILELAELIKETVNFTGQIQFDRSKPDGTPRKLLDISKLNKTGWSAKTSLKQGLKITYQWYLENVSTGKLKINDKFPVQSN